MTTEIGQQVHRALPGSTAEQRRRRMWAPIALFAAFALFATACGDELRFDLNGDIAVDIVDDEVIGSISIDESFKCGDDRITSITGTGTVPYGNADKTANFNINIVLNDLCHYVGLIELGFPGEPGDPYPICQFVQFDAITKFQRNGKHGVTGFGGTDQSCRSTGPVTLHNFVILDEDYTPST